MEFDGTAVQQCPKLSFSALGTAPQDNQPQVPHLRSRESHRLRDNLYFFPARIASSDSKHSDRQFFIGGNILPRSSFSRRWQIRSDGNEEYPAVWSLGPGEFLYWNRKDSRLGNAQRLEHSAQLGAAAQAVDHSRSAIRFCVVINHGHTGAGGFQSLENAYKPRWESPRGPRESRILHQNPGSFPPSGSAAKFSHCGNPPVLFPGDSLDLQIVAFCLQRFTEIPAILFHRIGGRIAPPEERDDAMFVHLGILISQRGSCRSRVHPCRS